jgi:hypothetical protein
MKKRKRHLTSTANTAIDGLMNMSQDTGVEAPSFSLSSSTIKFKLGKTAATITTADACSIINAFGIPDSAMDMKETLMHLVPQGLYCYDDKADRFVGMVPVDRASKLLYAHMKVQALSEDIQRLDAELQSKKKEKNSLLKDDY